jgi:hypothetical protein
MKTKKVYSHDEEQGFLGKMLANGDIDFDAIDSSDEEDGSVRVEKELAEIRTEQATIKSNLETVITEQAVIKSSLTSIQDSLLRLEKAFSNPPPSTDATGNNKRSNLAIQAPSNNLKKVKREMFVKKER